MTSYRQPEVIPVRDDSAFPAVCVDANFSYSNPESPETKLQALQDAERAFRLLYSHAYLAPQHYQEGIVKISHVVGTDVHSGNVKRLQRNLLRQLSNTSEANHPLFKKAQKLGAKLLRLLT